jgi:hypothetical protein
MVKLEKMSKPKEFGEIGFADTRNIIFPYWANGYKI